MTDVRIIKRYANRKLYDTQHSRYVTLDQIAEMIRTGDDVKIIDNKSKEDLTSVTLAQIIFEEEKRQQSFLPLQAMRNIIQSGGESITQLVHQAKGRVHLAKGRVSQILPKKKEGEEGEDEEHEFPADYEGEGHFAEVGALPDPDDDGSHGHKVREGLHSLREFREFLTQSQRAIDDWQRKVDGRIRTMFEGMSPFASLQKDIGTLSTRIAQLEAKLTSLIHDEPSDPDAE